MNILEKLLEWWPVIMIVLAIISIIVFLKYCAFKSIGEAPIWCLWLAD